MPKQKGAPCGAPFESSAEGWNNVPSVIGDDFFLIATVEIDVELGDPRRLQFMQLPDMVLGLAEHAEAFHHIVGDEIEIGIIGLAMLGIVVATALFDIAGQARGDLVAVGPIFLDNVGDMVATMAGNHFTCSMARFLSPK